MDDTEALAIALNEKFGTYPWDGGADKPVWRMRARELRMRADEIKEA
jgi:hypothetical protein